MASSTPTTSRANTDTTLNSLISPFLSLGLPQSPPASRRNEPALPNTFHRFPALPSSVRRMIWHRAFLGTQPPRVIEVRAHVEENLLWEIDCEEITFPEPTGSMVVRWIEGNPRNPCAIERVSQESRAVVEGAWDFCFGDRHSEDVEMIEEFRDQNGVKQVRYLDREIIEERLGVGFKRGIKFLRDRDTIYLKTRDFETKRALKDVRANMLELRSVKKVAIDIFWEGHYLLEKQLFEGWREDDKEADLKRRFPTPKSRYVREEPLLNGLEDLTLVMDVCPSRVGSRPIMPGLSSEFPGYFFNTQIVEGEDTNDEAFDTKMYSVVERLEKYEMIRSGNIKVELIGKGSYQLWEANGQKWQRVRQTILHSYKERARANSE
ncbi:hypothetical protein DSL72_007176 [Monilinia vaccinii-corymbosi]|uniref:2EXR domain-containing protein n=1 Tax=Monilinia vaccinii-corymbosi TaxID=61207 RepID=A0A8A3PKY6_9HELO|nr:hypothetical protein DSL72_007176 [Monilinia vaccinii-corymbosi]